MDSGAARPASGPPQPWPSQASEPVLPRAPGLSASARLPDMTSTTRTPYTEFVNATNSSRNEPQ